MTVQAGLCRTCSETTLLVFLRGGSNVFKLDITSIKVMTSVIKCLQIRLNFSDTRFFFLSLHNAIRPRGHSRHVALSKKSKYVNRMRLKAKKCDSEGKECDSEGMIDDRLK